MRFSTEALELLQAATEEIPVALGPLHVQNGLATKRPAQHPEERGCTEHHSEEYLMYLFADGYLASASDGPLCWLQLQKTSKVFVLGCPRQRPTGGA